MLKKLKAATLTPIPMPRTSTAMMVNPGERARMRDAIVKILEEAVEPGPAPGLAGLLAHAEHVAEVVAACAGGHLAVEFHVGLEFGIEPAAVEKIRNAAPEFAHGEASYAVRRMSWMAWVTRSYPAISALS